MYSVGLDVDKLFVSTGKTINMPKILLCAGNSYVNSPLVLITLGTIYLLFFYPLKKMYLNTQFFVRMGAICLHYFLFSLKNKMKTVCLTKNIGQLAGNFSFSTNASAVTKNTHTNYKNLPIISKHVPKYKSTLTDDEFG
jgi:hypothetical protein